MIRSSAHGRGGHPLVFLVVCALLAGAIMAGSWALVVLLAAWAVWLVVR